MFIKLGAAMAKLDDKLRRIEAYVREFAQDRDDFDKGKIPLQLDARIAKTWVRQFDQVISLLTAMLDDWKDVAALSQETDKHRAEVDGNGVQKGNPHTATRTPPSSEGSTDDQ